MVKDKSLQRCAWVSEDPIYIKYHDEEWGAPIYDDKTLFEFLVLEGAQAGLSWLTVLKRREGYREAFAGFDVERVARFSEADLKCLQEFPGIIRNQLKIQSAVRNAKVFMNIQEEFGSFSKYLWGFVNDAPVVNHPKTLAEVPVLTPLAGQISKDLRTRGMNFVGPTIIYAYLQAVGVVNDHVQNCYKSV
jgi:DNA-3-methyladenine glycosylase I